MAITGLETYGSTDASYDAVTKSSKNSSNEEHTDVSEFMKKFEEARQITAQELREDKDWRDMTYEEWDKLLAGIDQYIDTAKEQMKRMEDRQEEAAQKAAAKADSEMRTTAASSAALHVAAGGLAGVADGAGTPEKNWTKRLQTDDQTVLRVAKKAQEMERMAMAKYKEVQVTDETTADSGQGWENRIKHRGQSKLTV